MPPGVTRAAARSGWSASGGKLNTDWPASCLNRTNPSDRTMNRPTPTMIVQAFEWRRIRSSIAFKARVGHLSFQESAIRSATGAHTVKAAASVNKIADTTHRIALNMTAHQNTLRTKHQRGNIQRRREGNIRPNARMIANGMNGER